MSKSRSSILFTACISLLAVQLSGLHTHVNTHGYTGAPQTFHVHQDSSGGAAHENSAQHHDTGAHDHGQSGDTKHADDNDVSIVKFNSGLSKLSIFLVFLVLAILVPLRSGIRLPLSYLLPLPNGRRVRWRPLLRGPPAPLYPTH